MASTEQRNGFRLPWNGAADARPDGEAGSEDIAASTHGAVAPNRFQPILLRAMRAAAEENRNAMVAACREEAEASITAVHARSAAESETLRRVATGEITTISEYARAEIERITAEADEAIAARRTQLGQSLEEQILRVEQDIDTVRSRVAAFESDMTAFFARLEVVADPAEFAALTAQLPEPPRLFDVEDDLAAFMPRDGAVVTPAAETGQRRTAPTNGVAPTVRPTADAAPPATSEAPPVATPETVPAATDTIEAAPAMRSTGEPMVTTVVVAGLVNIASIAAFKRLVSGLRGVQSVAVSSGPGGEFVFKVSHETGIALGDEVTLLPGFSARIVDSREGLLQVSARDPGAAA